ALGFDPDGDCHKTMWLAPTGKPEFLEVFADLLRVDEYGLPIVRADYFDLPFGGMPSLSAHFFERVALMPRAKEEALAQKHRNLAASVQTRVEAALCEMAMRYRERTGEE